MKKIILLVITTVSLGIQAVLQPTANFPLEISANGQLDQITVYEHWNFTGKSKSFAPGKYRLYGPDDFNDIISSINIPAGMAVLVYEHADDEGGYGKYTDLLEDCPDFSVYNLNDQVSYLEIFYTTKPGFFYERGHYEGGQFIPGRWLPSNAPPPNNYPPATVSSVAREKSQPHIEDADIGYGDLIINLGDYTSLLTPNSALNFKTDDLAIVDGKANIDHICPQHRSVGEFSQLERPLKTYRALEGVVIASGVSYWDFPSSHYTHDFTFHVRPDPEYHYLLADSLLNGVRVDAQYDTEVEWETGLGQDNVLDGVANPATESRFGNSFGFFSAGHELRDVIWNWPTDGDRIHAEGLWIWERGHRPARTEIHPPHFIAVARKLPVSFIFDANNNPVIRNRQEDTYLATRVDVFASGDGGPMFNTKSLNPSFNQETDMNRKDYIFTIKHIFTKPFQTNTVLHSATLRCTYVKQKGDNFPAEPIIRFLGGNDVEVTVPWKSANVSNNSVFARTFLVYWEIVSTMPVPRILNEEKPKLYELELIRIDLKKKLDDDFYGDWRVYCNVGSSWIFLNEFAGNPQGENIMATGLGKAGNTNTFEINKTFNVYLPSTGVRGSNNILIYHDLPIKAMGWEADGLDIFMGHIIDEYSRDKDVVNRFFGSHLEYLNDNGREDENPGTINQLLNPFIIDLELNPNPRTLHAVYISEGVQHNYYDIIYRIRELPYSLTLPTNH